MCIDCRDSLEEEWALVERIICISGKLMFREERSVKWKAAACKQLQIINDAPRDALGVRGGVFAMARPVLT